MPAATATSSRQGSYGVLRFGRFAVMGAVAVLIVAAGVWGSWGTAQYVMLTKGRERGTIEVTRCGAQTCDGPFTPLSAGASARRSVVIEKSVAVQKGRTYTVVVRPGTDDVVRSGPSGIVVAWIPLGGALLLASVVVAGGLRLTRAAWVMAGAGVAVFTAVFVTL